MRRSDPNILASELELLGEAVEGIRLLSQGVDERRYGSERELRRACRAAAAMAALVTGRLEGLARGIRRPEAQ